VKAGFWRHGCGECVEEFSIVAACHGKVCDGVGEGVADGVEVVGAET
jgi:hypothetical protein